VRSQKVLLELETEEQPEGTRNHELWRADTFDSKEPDTLDWIDSFVKPGDVLYDVGANIGQYSLYAARKCGADLKVLAFEPEALNQAKLNRNIVLNGLVGTVVPHALAIADRTAIDTFYIQRFAFGASLHTWGKPVTQGEKPFEPQNLQGVMAVSLDDLTERFGLPFPTHIKIDVDGIEDQVVAGASRVLGDERLKSVLIEVFMHKDMADRVKDAFFRRGMALSNADTVDYTPGIVQNLIFTRPR
jgi:FkbM family methyltransferase